MKTKKLLLKEYNGISSSKNASIEGGVLYLKGVIQRADQKNNNGRIYPYDVLKKAIDKYQKLVAEQRSAGEANHPNSIEIDVKNICHYITDIWWEGKDVHGRLRITTNSIGKDIAALINDGMKLGISSRGFGSITKKGDDVIVNDDFELVGFDIVHDPSTAGAYVLKESGVYEKIGYDKLFEQNSIYLDNSIITESVKGKNTIEDILSKILKEV